MSQCLCFHSILYVIVKASTGISEHFLLNLFVLFPCTELMQGQGVYRKVILCCIYL